MLSLAYQGMIYAVKTKKPADPAYKDFQTLEFKISLPANQCMNWNSVHICFPIQIKKSMAVPNNINANMVPSTNVLYAGSKKQTSKDTGMTHKFYEKIDILTRY